MRKITIWVEGIADKKFLADVIQSWFGFSFDENFKYTSDLGAMIELRETGGVTGDTNPGAWEKSSKSIFTRNHELGIKNLIIVDADEDFDSRKKEVHNTIVNIGFNVDTDLFLWPDHQPHKERGDLETLLEQIIEPGNSVIFECWNNYEECLKNAPEKSYTLPARKTKIYAYLEALLGETNSEKEQIKERNRDYSNSKHWILDPDSESLKPLFDFLNKHLNQPENA